jgi:septum formation protein
MANDSLILGSTSPRRREMLAQAGFVFEIMAPPEDDNDLLADHSPGGLVETQALIKARAVAQERPEAIILAADTVVALYGRVLGKPLDEPEAITMLTDLSGRVHEVLTGFCLIQGESLLHQAVVRTRVEFRRLAGWEIRAYAATGSPLDKAGAYGIQDMGGGLVKSVEGSYTNVVGLPLAEVVEVLADQGISSAGGGG